VFAEGYVNDFSYTEAAAAAAWSLTWFLLKLSSATPPAEIRVADVAVPVSVQNHKN
jgi:hypothetical protein